MTIRAPSGRRRDPRRDFRPGSPQAAGECFVDAGAEDKLIANGALVDDFAGPMDLGEQLSVAGGEPNLGKGPARSNGHAERATQWFQSALLRRRDEHGVLHQTPDPLLQRKERLLIEQIDLVEDQQSWPVANPELLEHLLDDDALLLPRRLARVDDVEEEIRFCRLLERRAERGDEVMRQLPDESDGVGDEYLRLAHVDLARERVEGGEEPVLDEHVLAARKAGKDRRLARVRVPDERRLELALPRLPLHDATLLHVAQPALEKLDAGIDQPTIGLQLRFARAPHTDAPTKLFEVRPHPR